jgi:hypothetical protein
LSLLQNVMRRLECKAVTPQTGPAVVLQGAHLIVTEKVGLAIPKFALSR